MEHTEAIVNHYILKEWQIPVFSASYLLISYSHKTTQLTTYDQ
jgi:hypothetical protein